MPIFHPKKWATEHFAHANLGDIRRTRRLVSVGQQIATFSGESMARACNGVDAKPVQLSSNTRTFFKPVILDLYKSIYMLSPYPD